MGRAANPSLAELTGSVWVFCLSIPESSRQRHIRGPEFNYLAVVEGLETSWQSSRATLNTTQQKQQWGENLWPVGPAAVQKTTGTWRPPVETYCGEIWRLQTKDAGKELQPGTLRNRLRHERPIPGGDSVSTTSPLPDLDNNFSIKVLDCLLPWTN